MIIKKVDVWSAARIAGVFYALLGLIAGGIFAIVALVGAGVAGLEEVGVAGGFFSAFLGVGAIVFLPIVYGIMGVIVGALTAVLYNLVATMSGGLAIEIEQPARMA